MNMHARDSDAESAERKGNALYEKLLPTLIEQGCSVGDFVAINIETGRFVTAATRRELMISYKQSFGQSIGWVKRIEYGKS
jgi:hypothetical protein